MKFSVKKAYGLSGSQAVGTSQHLLSKWARMWKTPRPQRLNMNLLQARMDIFPTVALLFLRKCLDRPICTISGSALEFELHAV